MVIYGYIYCTVIWSFLSTTITTGFRPCDLILVTWSFALATWSLWPDGNHNRVSPLWPFCQRRSQQGTVRLYGYIWLYILYGCMVLFVNDDHNRVFTTGFSQQGFHNRVFLRPGCLADQLLVLASHKWIHAFLSTTITTGFSSGQVVWLIGCWLVLASHKWIHEPNSCCRKHDHTYQWLRSDDSGPMTQVQCLRSNDSGPMTQVG